MSPLAQFFLLAAIEIAGLFAIWFLIRARVRRYLDVENLLSGVREEARSLVLELNETADRNVSLVEDRMVALRELLTELDRRIVLEKRELSTREVERDVYAKLSRRRPIVPEPDQPAPAERQVPAVSSGRADQSTAALSLDFGSADAPITLNLGPAAEAANDQRRAPEVAVAEANVVPGMTRREEALELYRRGFSPDLIAARTGATVAEIELLVEIEERRAAGRGKF